MHATRGSVVYYPSRGRADEARHEDATHIEICRHLAAFLGYDYAGDYAASSGSGTPVYLVPSDSLSADEAAWLGVRGEQDLFGGVVHRAFVATKVIGHPLVDRGAACPEGWSHDFAAGVQDIVLEGYSAFSVEDARSALVRLLESGPARVKLARGIGGTGQTVAHGAADLDRVLAALDPAELARHGAAIERDLANVTTYSVGLLRIPGLAIAYCGTQNLTRNNDGKEVYGGSDLRVVRGDFGSLLDAGLDPATRLAVMQARRYDAAASQAYPGFFASRRNYDVAAGSDGGGNHHSGVLEQSWRIGGASPAEIAAVDAFSLDPQLNEVRASVVEKYGACTPPGDAVVYFRGVDPRVGKLTKYSLIRTDGNAD